MHLTALSKQSVGQKPTLKTIAELTGLAVPTISRALNDAPDIGADTKQLVRKVAESIGYVPNRAGVRLRTGRTNVVSLVMSTEHDPMNHSARLISSVAAGLRDTKYHVIVTPFFPDEDPLRPIKYIIEAKLADGIIFNQTKPEDPRVAFLMDRQFPFATHGRTKWSERHSFYDFDNATFGRLAVEQLVARGRKHIALLAPPLEQNYSVEMLQAVIHATSTTGRKMTLVRGVTSDSPSVEISTEIQKLLMFQPDVDAIITGSVMGAIASVTGVESKGLEVGIDIDVLAKEAVPFLKSFRSSILTLSEKVGVAGEFLAKAILHRINEPDALPMQELEVPVVV